MSRAHKRSVEVEKGTYVPRDPLPDKFVVSSPGRSVSYHTAICKTVRTAISNKKVSTQYPNPFVSEVSDRTIDICELDYCSECEKIENVGEPTTELISDD